MNMDMEVLRVIALNASCSIDELKPSTNLRTDLGMDDTDIEELCLCLPINQKHEGLIPAIVFKHWNTVQDVVKYMEMK